jgi:hypothetical protein
MRGFLRNLRHPYRIVRSIEIVEGRGLKIELISQYQDKISRNIGMPLRDPRMSYLRSRCSACRKLESVALSASLVSATRKYGPL